MSSIQASDQTTTRATPPTTTLGRLAVLLGGELNGPADVAICGVASSDRARAGDVCVLSKGALLESGCRAAALVTADPDDRFERPWIRVADSRAALVTLLRHFHPELLEPAGIEPGANVSPDARLADGVYVAAGATIAADVDLGEGVQVHPGCVVGRGARVGAGTVLYPNATVYPGTLLGQRVRVHAGAVVGSPGFGYHRETDGSFTPIPQIGQVEVGDDVDIGANSTVDRATLDRTRIGRGTKIDNLVQIAHNSDVGEDCCLAAQVGIAGSVTIGDGVVLSGQVGVADHRTVAAGAVVGGQAGVARDLPRGEYWGSPAMTARQARRAHLLFPRLPEMMRELQRLHARVRELETRIDGEGQRNEAGS